MISNEKKITFSLWEAVKHKLTHKSKTWKIEVTLQKVVILWKSC